MLRIQGRAALAAAVLSFGAVLGLSAGSAGASPVLFDFDDVQGQPDPYISNGFKFEPTQFQNSARCFGDPNSNCLLEADQGDTTTLTHDGDGDGAFDDEFALSFFYFNLTGSPAENSFTVTGTKADNSTISATFVLQQTTASGAVATDATISFAKLIGSYGTDNPNLVSDKAGYWVDLGAMWTMLTSVAWTNNTTSDPNNGQFRLDCVGVNVGEGSGVTGAESGCVPGAVIPLPAPVFLLLGGMGILGLAARRRKDGVMV
jgi:hypothetical protein